MGKPVLESASQSDRWMDWNEVHWKGRMLMGQMSGEITEIAQAMGLLSARLMREEGLGASESDLLQLVKAQPGISQKEICVRLGMDKGAVARRAVNLEQKGYLTRKSNPADARSQILYPTEQADLLKGSGAEAEGVFCDWLLESLSEEERVCFCESLERLYERAVQECGEGYPHVCERLNRAPFESGRTNVKSIKVKKEDTVFPEEKKTEKGAAQKQDPQKKEKNRRADEPVDANIQRQDVEEIKDTQQPRQREPDIWLL